MSFSSEILKDVKMHKPRKEKKKKKKRFVSTFQSKLGLWCSFQTHFKSKIHMAQTWA
jgi:hypothetical protein